VKGFVSHFTRPAVHGETAGLNATAESGAKIELQGKEGFKTSELEWMPDHVTRRKCKTARAAHCTRADTGTRSTAWEKFTLPQDAHLTREYRRQQTGRRAR